jgi:hypothetical protein
MFLPGRNVQEELEAKQRIFRRIEEWSMSEIPLALQADCTVSVQEVQCGDPQCAPIDTVVTLLFER